MIIRHYNGPQKTSQEPKDSSQRNCSKGPCSPTGGETKEMESNSKMYSDRKMHRSAFDKEFLDMEVQVEEKYAVRKICTYVFPLSYKILYYLLRPYEMNSVELEMSYYQS